MIRINDTYYIEPDPFCWILKKTVRGTSKKGEDIRTEKTLGYYGTVEGAAMAAVDEIFKERVEDIDMGLKDALEAFRALKEDIRKAIEGEER